MLLVDGGRAQARILLGPGPSWLERHAAEELAGYLGDVTSATFRIDTGDSGEGPVIAVGNPDTNPIIRQARDSGHLSLSASFPGQDGFVIRTIDMNGRKILILGGSSMRGTLYAVYHFLEEVIGVGFFRDGEHLPDIPRLRLGEIDIVERPRFAEREDGSGCIFAYSTPFWAWDDWKRELDWRAKRRANIIWPFNVGGEILDLVLYDWGVLPNRPGPGEGSLHRRAFDYARKLGMRMPIILPNGSLPDSFYRAHPDSKTLLTQYSEYAPTRQLHPGDRHFKRLIVDFIRRHVERYGTDHIYIAEFVSESRILRGAEDAQEARIQFARAVSEAISEADPEGIWAPSSWSFDTFHDPPEGWTPAQIRDYLEAISVPMVVWDLWSEEAAKYEITDFFFGKPWGFGVLHCFGGNNYLHGDVEGLISRVQSLLKNPRSEACNLFLSCPEIIDFNGFYLELAAKLSWDPGKVSLPDYVRQFCQHRYGRYGGELEPAWWELVRTVYGPKGGSIVVLMDPLYWLRPNLSLVHGSPKVRDRALALWEERDAFIPPLRRALEGFLGHEDLVRENQMARRDMVDVARQWVAERFNRQFRAARDAFLGGFSEHFEDSAGRCLNILDEQVRLLSSWPPYRLERKIELARPILGERAEQAVKHFHLWVTYQLGPEHESEPLLDYYRMDLDGLVRDYYRPRVQYFLEHLRRQMSTGSIEVDEAELESGYMVIARDFVSSPGGPPLRSGEDPVEVVRELLRKEAGRSGK